MLAIMMDYLTNALEVQNQRIAAIVTNLQDALSSLFFVAVSQTSQTYTGCFTMITFCAAASIEVHKFLVYVLLLEFEELQNVFHSFSLVFKFSIFTQHIIIINITIRLKTSKFHYSFFMHERSIRVFLPCNAAKVRVEN